MKQKALINVSLDDKSRIKAMRIVASDPGIVAFSWKGAEKNQLEVVGDVDIIKLVTSIRNNFGYAEVVRVAPVKEEPPKKDKELGNEKETEDVRVDDEEETEDDMVIERSTRKGKAPASSTPTKKATTKPGQPVPEPKKKKIELKKGSHNVSNRTVEYGKVWDFKFLSISGERDIPEIVHFQQWTDLLQYKEILYPGLVKEFYKHLSIKEGTVSSKVKGKSIRFTASDLGEILKVPVDGIEYNPRVNLDTDGWTVQRMMERFCTFPVQGEVKSLNAKYELAVPNRFLHFMVSKSLLQRQEKLSTVCIQDVGLMHLLDQRKVVNLPATMINHMEYAISYKSHSLPYGHWLTLVFKAFKIKLDGEEKMPMSSQTIMGPAVLKKMRLHVQKGHNKAPPKTVLEIDQWHVTNYPEVQPEVQPEVTHEERVLTDKRLLEHAAGLEMEGIQLQAKVDRFMKEISDDILRLTAGYKFFAGLVKDFVTTVTSQ